MEHIEGTTSRILTHSGVIFKLFLSKVILLKAQYKEYIVYTLVSKTKLDRTNSSKENVEVI